MHNFLDPTWLIKNFGYLGIFLTIFLESGIIVGFFLPGDSFLFIAGLLASQHYLSLPLVMLLAVTGAILGNTVGYYTGRKLGVTLLNKESFQFFRKRAKEAHVFFEKQGPQSLVLARFIPAVRCFVPIISGVAEMNYKVFLKFNALGGILWGMSIPLLGYTLGKSIPGIDKYLLPVVLLIGLISALPLIIPYVRAKFHYSKGLPKASDRPQ